jgi:hypothetical protein
MRLIRSIYLNRRREREDYRQKKSSRETESERAGVR